MDEGDCKRCSSERTGGKRKEGRKITGGNSPRFAGCKTLDDQSLRNGLLLFACSLLFVTFDAPCERSDKLLMETPTTPSPTLNR